MKSLLLAVFLLAIIAAVHGQQSCSPVQCLLECESGFLKNKNGCEVCKCQPSICEDNECSLGTVCKGFILSATRHVIPRCVDPSLPGRCHYPLDPGPCRGSIERFYYNTQTGVCEKYAYGGCKGNENNFDNEKMCADSCLPGMCEDSTSCDLECEHGLAHDEFGCEQCECRDISLPRPTRLPESCRHPTPTCLAFCEHGSLRDASGCEVCICAPPTTLGEACNSSIQASCLMACEHGFLFDVNKCQVCQCAPAPEARQCATLAPTCHMACDHGFKKDTLGCDTCECAGCPDTRATCAMICKYGYAVDDSGCAVCDCQSDPCEVFNCDEGQVCQSVRDSSGAFMPTCLRAQLREWCAPIACDMYCEHGFAVNQRGCEECACKQTPELPACTLEACPNECVYGNAFDDSGCRTCECLPNPCQVSDCLLKHVCEVKRVKGCPSCPARAECLAERLVKRLRIKLQYVHAPKDVDEHEFSEAVEKSVSSLMMLDEEYIHGIMVRTPVDDVVTVEMDIVGYGQENLVELFTKLRELITQDGNYAAIFHDGMTFVPTPTSLYVDYSSSEEADAVERLGEIEVDEDEGDSTTLIIIVACSVAGVAIIVAIVTVVLVRRAKGKAKKKSKYDKSRHSNVSYKKPTDAESGENVIYKG